MEAQTKLIERLKEQSEILKRQIHDRGLVYPPSKVLKDMNRLEELESEIASLDKQIGEGTEKYKDFFDDFMNHFDENGSSAPEKIMFQRAFGMLEQLKQIYGEWIRSKQIAEGKEIPAGAEEMLNEILLDVETTASVFKDNSEIPVKYRCYISELAVRIEIRVKEALQSNNLKITKDYFKPDEDGAM